MTAGEVASFSVIDTESPNFAGNENLKFRLGRVVPFEVLSISEELSVVARLFPSHLPASQSTE